jgi:hypothetical protein
LRIRLDLLGCALIAAGALWAAPAAAAAPASCARTTDPSAAATPTPGNPCWTDVTPYPFGADGNEVDPSSGSCGTPDNLQPGPGYQGDFGGNNLCYLRADSMAFRAWNRGLAAVRLKDGTTPFGVWLFNGRRWFPDPTFPGQSTCSGKTVLWAGKLDYWLVGAGAWGRLCRFDGVSLQWEPLPVPKAALAHVPVVTTKDNVAGSPALGGINTGACFAWDGCWFFGNFGVVLHWDGQALSDASTGLVASPWLRGDFTAAVARTDPAGRPFGFAVTNSGPNEPQGSQLPSRPDGTPPAQLFGSTGGPFSALSFSPPTAPVPGDPYRTDLVAVDFTPQGGGWVVGNPVGATFSGLSGRGLRTAQPAPLTRLDAGGTPFLCPGYDGSTFAFEDPPRDTYIWSSVAALPGTGVAVAGGGVKPVAGGTNPNNRAGLPEPMLVRADCGRAPIITRFVIPDPFDADQAHAAHIPADRSGDRAVVAATAANDAWAATAFGAVVRPDGSGTINNQRPHIYRLTNGQPPLTPAGDDYEPRPSIFKPDPPVYQVLPAPTPAPTPITQTVTKTQTKVVKKPGKPAIYATKAKLQRSRTGAFTLVISFKVRAPITIGAQALRRGRVVSSTGLKRFKPKSGQLVLRLDPKHWPTKIKFVIPQAGKGAGAESLSATVAADLQPIAAG